MSLSFLPVLNTKSCYDISKHLKNMYISKDEIAPNRKPRFGAILINAKPYKHKKPPE